MAALSGSNAGVPVLGPPKITDCVGAGRNVREPQAGVSGQLGNGAYHRAEAAKTPGARGSPRASPTAGNREWALDFAHDATGERTGHPGKPGTNLSAFISLVPRMADRTRAYSARQTAAEWPFGEFLWTVARGLLERELVREPKGHPGEDRRWMVEYNEQRPRSAPGYPKPA